METPPNHEAPSAVTLPSEHVRPDYRTQKYDRQLRLWAASGQASLESAHVLVVGGNATATSMLKNLVLPGIGQFTILDDKRIDEADLGNNFFLEPGSSKLGDARAEEAVKFLGELNDGVKAHAVVQSVSEFLNASSGSDPLAPYSLVITVNAPPEDTLQLSDRCWDAGLPLIAVKSSGFVGSVRTQMQEVHFIETHPEQAATLDLRLDHPFPSLAKHTSSIDFASLNSHDYAHIPAIVILLQALQQWKDSHDGNMPRNYDEKSQFRKSIHAMKRGGAGADHENFEEAVDMVMKAVKPTVIPDNLQKLFKESQCEHITASSAPFWILLRAVRNFVQSPSTNEGASLLPLAGSLPDMKATSSGYGTLQSLYRSKAKEDMAAVRQELSATLQEAGLPDDGSIVNDEMLAVFVKNAAFVQVVRGSRMRDEYERPNQKTINQALSEASAPSPFAIPDEDGNVPPPNAGPLHFYLALRAADTFYLEHSRWPGSLPEAEDAEGEKDFDDLWACAERVATICTGESYGEEASELVEKAVKEIARAGGADLPQMAALLGGIIAQEAIKIVTKQYVPLNGTLIFDGITSTSQSFNF